MNTISAAEFLSLKSYFSENGFFNFDLEWPQVTSIDLNLTSCDHSTSNVHKKLLKLSLTEKWKKWWLRHKSLEWWLRSSKLKRAVPDDVLEHLQKVFWKYQLPIRLQDFHKIGIFWNFDGHSWTLEFIFFPKFSWFCRFSVVLILFLKRNYHKIPFFVISSFCQIYIFFPNCELVAVVGQLLYLFAICWLSRENNVNIKIANKCECLITGSIWCPPSVKTVFVFKEFVDICVRSTFFRARIDRADREKFLAWSAP